MRLPRAPLAGRHPQPGLEVLAEPADVAIADAKGDLGHRQAAGAQQGLCRGDAGVDHILQRAVAGGGLEGAGKVKGTDPSLAGQRFQRQVVG